MPSAGIGRSSAAGSVLALGALVGPLVLIVSAGGAGGRTGGAVAGVGAQAASEGVATASDFLFGRPPPTISEPRAVLLTDATLRADPDDDAEASARLPAGTVVTLVETIEDAFGRPWNVVRDPAAVRRRRDVFLAPFDADDLERYGGEAAFLDLRMPPPPPAGAAAPPPTDALTSRWWTRSVAIGPDHMPRFGALVGVGARRLPVTVARRALELVGGLQGLGPMPEGPRPGRLHASEALPLLLRFEGDEWHLVDPPLLLDVAPSLLGNPWLVVDDRPPVPAGGPRLPCWRLVGALDPRGEQVGRIVAMSPAAAPAPPPEEWRRVDPLRGGIDLTPSAWPPAGPLTYVPPRLAREVERGGVELHDESSRQAVYLEQTLSPSMTRALRGETLRLDVWARAAPAAARTGVATVGALLEAGGERASAGESLGSESRQVTVTLVVPRDAERIRVVLLAQDASVAVEQRGSAILERAVLGLAAWPLEPPSDYVPLREVTVTSWQGVRRFTRAPLAVTDRPTREIELIWPLIEATDWSQDDRRLVLAGHVRAGMTAEQVRASWGDPESTVTDDDLVGIDARWDWPDRSAVFAGGVLVGWSPPPPSPPDPVPPMRCPGVAAPSPDGGPGIVPAAATATVAHGVDGRPDR